MNLHEKEFNIVLDILDRDQLICGPKKGKFVFESVVVVVAVEVCCETGHVSRVQGSSSQSRSGSALRPFHPFVNSLAVVIFTIPSSRIRAGTLPPLLDYSKSVGRLAVQARECKCSGPTRAMRRLYN